MRLLGIIALLFWGCIPSHAQSFMVQFGDPVDRTAATGIYQHYDSSVYVCANALDPQNHNAILLTKFDQYGVEDWSYKMPSVDSEYSFDMAFLNGYLYFFGRKDAPSGLSYAFVKKTDLNGTEIWSKSIPNGTKSAGFRAGSAWGNNGLVAIGFINDTINNNNNSYTVNLDEQGNVLWEHELNITNNNNGQELTVEGNDVYLVCDRQKANFAYSLVVQSLNNLGVINWTDTVVTAYNSGSQNAYVNNGELFVVGESSTATSIQFDPILIKYDAATGLRKSFNFVDLTPNSEAAFDAIPIDDQRLIMCGYGHNSMNGGSDFMLTIIDTTGTVDQTRFYGNNEFDLATDALKAMREGTFFCGELRQTGRRYGALLYFDEFGYNSIADESTPLVSVKAVSNESISLNERFIGSYQIIDLKGKLISKGSVNGNQINLKQTCLPHQIYVLRLMDSDGRGITNHKLILR